MTKLRITKKYNQEIKYQKQRLSTQKNNLRKYTRIDEQNKKTTGNLMTGFLFSLVIANGVYSHTFNSNLGQ